MSHKPMPESFIQIDIGLPQGSHKPLLESGSDHNVKFIAAPSFGANVEIMHKGQVSDDNLDISNTYVKIGKTEAQVHASDDVQTPIIAQPINPPNMNNMIVFSHIKHPMNIENIEYSPLTMQSIQDMETMQPPPITMTPVFTKASPMRIPKNDTRTTSIKENDVETTTEFLTTTSTALTTDPLFKHYKQPIEPLKGPMYLIIQGHSKVKTYGPSKTVHGISIQESNEISDGGDENDEFEVRHLHNYSNKSGGDEKYREGRSGKLQTLKHVIETGFGAIDSSDLKDGEVTASKRSDVQETEVQGSFKVLTGDITSEKYHKGIVEAARKLKDFGLSRSR
ncbi:hypothetical protein WA026_015578 [Henosepilachna vigintioctopunctata]|uniref:Senescence domain-containing protein n=1 Tax=Henosepilachna vigintioctopunctata TaxID=420089 RepID=A0AAW1VH91_9CUCU